MARAYGWASPAAINEMYCDRIDHLGLLYWSDDVIKQNKEIEKQMKGKK